MGNLWEKPRISVNRFEETPLGIFKVQTRFKKRYEPLDFYGFDTEYHPQTHQLLSFQIFSPKVQVVETNVTTEDLVNKIQKYVGKSRKVVLVSHWGYAELSHFLPPDFGMEDFGVVIQKKKTGCDFRIKNLIFRDLFNFFPFSLRKVGEWIGIRKIEVDRRQIHCLLKSDPFKFRQYALNDARICYYAFKKLVDYLGYGVCYYGFGNFAVNCLLNRIKISGVFPLTDGRHVYYYPKNIQSHYLGLLAYFGGRSEAYIRGKYPEKIFVYDATQLYPNSALRVSLPPPFSEPVKLKEFDFDIPSIYRIRFKYPDDTMYPHIPVHTDKLYFPLMGEAWITASELEGEMELLEKIELLDGWGWRQTDNTLQNVLVEIGDKFKDDKLMRKTIQNVLIGKLCEQTQIRDIHLQLKTGILPQKLKAVIHGKLFLPHWACFILGYARRIMQKTYGLNPLFISTDSICIASNLGGSFNVEDIEFKKESEGYLTLIRTKLYHIASENGSLVDTALHGTLLTPQQFHKWIINREMPPEYEITKLSTLHDLVLRKTKTLAENITVKRKMSWEWDGKRILLKPNVNIFEDYSPTQPLPVLKTRASFWGMETKWKF